MADDSHSSGTAGTVDFHVAGRLCRSARGTGKGHGRQTVRKTVPEESRRILPIAR